MSLRNISNLQEKDFKIEIMNMIKDLRGYEDHENTKKQLDEIKKTVKNMEVEFIKEIESLKNTKELTKIKLEMKNFRLSKFQR